jgi:hypothetical protein
VVVVRGSRAPDGVGPAAETRCAILEWASFRLAGEGCSDLPRDEAQAQARLLAGHRHRRAWDSVGGQLRPLPSAPVVSLSSGAYWVSIDVTEPEDGATVTRWRSATNLSKDEALALLADSGFGGRLGAELLASAGPAQHH